MINVLQVALLFVAFAVLAGIGALFYKQVGVWGMLPAILVVLVLAAIMCVGVVRTMSESVRFWRTGRGSKKNP